MSRTPAADLARLKVRFPAWSIRKIEQGKGVGFTAHRRDSNGRRLRSIYAPSLTDLERQLSRVDG